MLSLEKKLEIIAELRKGKSQRLASVQFGIPKSTVGDIWKEREKIETHVSASENPSFAKKRCIVREPHFDKLDQACYLWFQHQRSKGAPVSGPLIQEKSLQLFPSLYPDKAEGSFKASSGWLHKFCVRHGIRELSLQGESLSADTSAVDTFCDDLCSKMENEGYTLSQVFNADETGLWWRLMPSKSLVDCGEKKAKNFKKSKDRVTLLGCANASGTCRLPLVFISKSAKPRCFKHMDMSSLPVHYVAQKNSWMDAKIFEEWFHKRFVPHVKEFCLKNSITYKVLLLLDNAPAHPSTDKLVSADGKVTTLFLPANTTSVLQPMDQGILEALKRQYKKQLLRHLIIQDHSSTLSVPDVLKQLTIKDAVYWCAQAWEEITAQSLSKSWNKLLTPATTVASSAEAAAVDESGESAGFVELFKDLGYEEGNQNWQHPTDWLAEDSDDPGHQILSDNEIVAEINGEADDLPSDTDVDKDSTETTVSHAKAYEALGITLEWLEAQGDTAHLLLVKKWRDTAARKRFDCLKQSKILSFFSRNVE